MLIEFKVSNFQCFRDEVVLNLVPAGQDKSLPGNVWQGRRERALKSAAIYGPNASGKTTLLHALYVLRQFVVESATKMTVGDPIAGIDPFRLSSDTRDKPSGFEVLVELDGEGFRYRVEATRERVWREKLEHERAEARSQWVTLIDRDMADPDRPVVTLHERLGAPGRREQIKEDTRDNALILSRAAERNVEPVLPLFNWFRKSVRHLRSGPGAPPDALLLRTLAEKAATSETYREQFLMLLRDADTGIAGVGTESFGETSPFLVENVEGDVPPDVKDALGEIQKAFARLFDLSKKESVDVRSHRFYTEHASSDGASVRFDLDDESTGTLRYWLLAGRMLDYCQGPSLIVVDELDASLHPRLARRVIQMAHSPEFGKAGAQLIFTTHDVTLMDPSLLRRDQIFFTQKNADGAAELYSLWDFESKPRNAGAWARNYLAGRFGAVPVFGPALADIPQADEPTPVEPSAKRTSRVSA